MIEHTLKENQQHQQQPTTNQPQTNQCPEKKWVHNLTNHVLTEAQEKVLAHGPNFVVVANQPPTGEYIAQIERICQKMKQGEAEEIKRSDIADPEESNSTKA